jgi:hypothetical protein
MFSSPLNNLLVGELVGFVADTLQTPAALSHSQAASLLHFFAFVKELHPNVASAQALAGVTHWQVKSFLHIVSFIEEHFGLGEGFPDLGDVSLEVGVDLLDLGSFLVDLLDS